MAQRPIDQVLQHVVDVHCHPTDAFSISPGSMDRLQITICAMSTMQSDQQLVRKLATAYPEKVIPCFGYHPWFSHLICTQQGLTKEEHYRKLFMTPSQPSRIEAFNKLLSMLPDPRSLNDVLVELRDNLSTFPVAMLGEVGLDRIFRVPYDYDVAPRDLTPFTIPLDHQLAILTAQLEVAVELGRNVSIHSVKSQLATTDLLARMYQKHKDDWLRISIDLHSCGLSPETWRDIERNYTNVFLSLSTVINSRHANHKSLIAACSPDRILVESDYNDIDMCTEQTWSMLRTVAGVKGWNIEEVWDENLEKEHWGAVRILEQNWKRFQKGSHRAIKKKKGNKSGQ